MYVERESHSAVPTLAGLAAYRLEQHHRLGRLLLHASAKR